MSMRWIRLRKALLLALLLGLTATGLAEVLLPAEYASQMEVRIVPASSPGWNRVAMTASYAAYLEFQAAKAAQVSPASVTHADLPDQSQISCERRMGSLDEMRWVAWSAWDPALIAQYMQQSCRGMGGDAVLLITVNDRDPGRAQALGQALFQVLDEWRSQKNASVRPGDRIYLQATSTSTRNLSMERARIIGGLGALLGFAAAMARRPRRGEPAAEA